MGLFRVSCQGGQGQGLGQGQCWGEVQGQGLQLGFRFRDRVRVRFRFRGQHRLPRHASISIFTQTDADTEREQAVTSTWSSKNIFCTAGSLSVLLITGGVVKLSFCSEMAKTGCKLPILHGNRSAVKGKANEVSDAQDGAPLKHGKPTAFSRDPVRPLFCRWREQEAKIQSLECCKLKFLPAILEKDYITAREFAPKSSVVNLDL